MVGRHFILILTLFYLINRIQSQAGTVCSTFCSTGNCTGWTMLDCNYQCFTSGGWIFNPLIGMCDLNNASGTNKTVMSYSDDAGGDMSVSDDLGTGCTFSGNTYYYGAYKASKTVTVSLSMGTYIPHYAMDVYFNLAILD